VAAGKRRKRRAKKGTQGPAAAAPARLRPGLRATIGRAASLVGAAAVVCASVWLLALYPTGRGPGDGRAVEVDVPRDATAPVLASILARAGVLSSPRTFALWLRATGGARAIVPGRHLVTDDASPRELVARLERRGSATTARVTFPEGWTRFDMARRLQERRVVPLRDFLEATTDPELLRELGIDGDSAEGFLFPATYDLPLDSDARDVVRRMKREFERRWDQLSRAHSSSLTDVMVSARFGVREVVTLGSIVEKEAAVDEERPIIAGVFLNRLRDPAFRPRRLESDPTASYGCVVAPEKAATCLGFSGKATASIEHDPDNAYSTYTHEGLPPGPIANPGAKSLEAAMAPAASPYFFFVAKGEGRHTFSATYEAHAAAVRDGGR
jgi:UPF0755 protein